MKIPIVDLNGVKSFGTLLEEQFKKECDEFWNKLKFKDKAEEIFLKWNRQSTTAPQMDDFPTCKEKILGLIRYVQSQERAECAEAADEHSCKTWKEGCNCAGIISKAIRNRGEK